MHMLKYIIVPLVVLIPELSHAGPVVAAVGAGITALTGAGVTAAGVAATAGLIGAGVGAVSAVKQISEVKKARKAQQAQAAQANKIAQRQQTLLEEKAAADATRLEAEAAKPAPTTVEAKEQVSEAARRARKQSSGRKVKTILTGGQGLSGSLLGGG